MIKKGWLLLAFLVACSEKPEARIVVHVANDTTTDTALDVVKIDHKGAEPLPLDSGRIVIQRDGCRVYAFDYRGQTMFLVTRVYAIMAAWNSPCAIAP